MAHPTVLATQKNIETREALVAQLRRAVKKMSPGPRKRAAVQRIEKLLHEISVMKASLHYYEPDEELAERLKKQTAIVALWTGRFKQAKGVMKKRVGIQLQKELRTLQQMKAASQAKALNPEMQAEMPPEKPAETTFPDLHLVVDEVKEGEVTEESTSSTFVPSNFTDEDSLLPVPTEEGVAAWLILRRR